MTATILSDLLLVLVGAFVGYVLARSQQTQSANKRAANSLSRVRLLLREVVCEQQQLAEGRIHPSDIEQCERDLAQHLDAVDLSVWLELDAELASTFLDYVAMLRRSVADSLAKRRLHIPDVQTLIEADTEALLAERITQQKISWPYAAHLQVLDGLRTELRRRTTRST